MAGLCVSFMVMDRLEGCIYGPSSYVVHAHGIYSHAMICNRVRAFLKTITVYCCQAFLRRQDEFLESIS